MTLAFRSTWRTLLSNLQDFGLFESLIHCLLSEADLLHKREIIPEQILFVHYSVFPMSYRAHCDLERLSSRKDSQIISDRFLNDLQLSQKRIMQDVPTSCPNCRLTLIFRRYLCED
jgi:hypothetical protein